jgi:hypothetical protein
MIASRSLLAGAVVAVLAQCNTASAADTRVQASSGVQYSDGKYGDTTSTSAIVVPFSVRASFGSWSIRASVPFVTVDGPADVSEIIDDSSGRGSSSGSGSSGSGSGSGSGSSGSGSSGSGSGGSGGGDDDDDVGSANRSVSGIGDASIALTYSLDAIGDSPAYVDFTGRVRLPTGDEAEGLGVGATDYVASTELGWDGDPGGVFVSAGRRFLGEVDAFERVDGWQASAGGWVNISDSAVIGAYYDWRNSSTRDGDDPSSVEAYVSWRLNEAWKIELNGGVGLSDASADYTAGLTLIWRSTKR